MNDQRDWLHKDGIRCDEWANSETGSGLGDIGRGRHIPQCWVARDHHSVGSAIICHWRTCVSLAVRCLCELCLHRVGASSDMVIVVIILMRDKAYYSGCACKVDLCMWQGDLEVPASRLAFDFLGEGCNGRNAATKNGYEERNRSCHDDDGNNVSEYWYGRFHWCSSSTQFWGSVFAGSEITEFGVIMGQLYKVAQCHWRIDIFGIQGRFEGSEGM